MKYRISFDYERLEIEVPEETDMDKYLKENAWELVQQLIDECAIWPESCEEVEEK